MTDKTTKQEQAESLYHAALMSVRSARDTLKAAYAIAKEEGRATLAQDIVILADEIQRAAFTGFDDAVTEGLEAWADDDNGIKKCPACNGMGSTEGPNGSYLDCDTCNTKGKIAK